MCQKPGRTVQLCSSRTVPKDTSASALLVTTAMCHSWTASMQPYMTARAC